MSGMTAMTQLKGSDKRIIPKLTITSDTTSATSGTTTNSTTTKSAPEVFSVQYSPDGEYIASGCGDGAIRVFNAETGRLAYNLVSGTQHGLPVTTIRWRPLGTGNNSMGSTQQDARLKTKNILLSASSNGNLCHWHVTSGKLLHTIEEYEVNEFHHKTENKNEIYCLEYRKDGGQFATAGKDCGIHVYDEITKEEVTILKGGMSYGTNAYNSTPGHSNRIFSLKFHPISLDLIISAGWDNTIQIWSIRERHAIRSIYGPHLGGDALDFNYDGTFILTGSYRTDHVLQVWSFDDGKLHDDISWTSATTFTSQPCKLYAAKYSNANSKYGSRFIAAGGTGANEAKVFDTLKDNALVGTIAGMDRGIFTMDWSPDSTKICLGGGDGSIRIVELIDKPPNNNMNTTSNRQEVDVDEDNTTTNTEANME